MSVVWFWGFPVAFKSVAILISLFSSRLRVIISGMFKLLNQCSGSQSVAFSAASQCPHRTNVRFTDTCVHMIPVYTVGRQLKAVKPQALLLPFWCCVFPALLSTLTPFFKQTHTHTHTVSHSFIKTHPHLLHPSQGDEREREREREEEGE